MLVLHLNVISLNMRWNCSTLISMITEGQSQENQTACDKKDILDHRLVVIFVWIGLACSLELCKEWIGPIRLFLCTFQKLVEAILHAPSAFSILLELLLEV